MFLILFAAAIVASFPAMAFAYEGQTGEVIFEDKFTGDSGGWNFDDKLVLKPPGTMLATDAAEGGRINSYPNETFPAKQGDFGVEMSFPQNAAQIAAEIAVAFLATDYNNRREAFVYADGKAGLSRVAGGKWSTVWTSSAADNLVKTGSRGINSVRAVVKNGTITVIVNGKTMTCAPNFRMPNLSSVLPRNLTKFRARRFCFLCTPTR